MSKSKIFSLLFCLAVLGVFYLTPVLVGLEASSWHFLGLFAAVILQVMPLGAVCLIAIVALSGITTPQSQIRTTHIKSWQGIMMSDNANSQKIAMDKATEEAI
ncbi:hypothetical protein [Campylobacter upsaliensis]|uniref:hypothetical protein n=1 Tax=Campylobacter upsaliensis TaxID=28080 RepID=UPI0022EB04A3|nr:hypothetical protein [Campylobacter upsaliensis]